MSKRSILLASLATFAALVGALTLYFSRGEFASKPPVVSRVAQNIAQAKLDPVLAVDESVLTEAESHPLDRAIASGYVNGDFIDYADMGEGDPRFQERFFVLPRHGVSDSEGCAKITMQEDTHACWNDYHYHPYFAYDVSALRQLAESDAAAAAVLALKLQSVSPDETLFFKLRAAQLSGKPGPLVSYLQTHRTYFDDQMSKILNVDETLELYAIALVVDSMGYPYIQTTERAALLNHYGISNYLQEKAEANSERILAELRKAP